MKPKFLPQKLQKNDFMKLRFERNLTILLVSPVEVGAASHCVVCEMLLALLVPKVLQRVGPQQVAHRAVRRRLFESV